MLNELLEEIARLQDAEDLLNTILFECGEYGYEIPKMSHETLMRVQRFKKWDDGE